MKRRHFKVIGLNINNVQQQHQLWSLSLRHFLPREFYSTKITTTRTMLTTRQLQETRLRDCPFLQIWFALLSFHVWNGWHSGNTFIKNLANVPHAQLWNLLNRCYLVLTLFTLVLVFVFEIKKVAIYFKWTMWVIDKWCKKLKSKKCVNLRSWV